MISACSAHQKKSNTKSTNSGDRSTSLEYTRSVTFLSAEGDSLTSVRVAVADDQNERSAGLMNVNSLPEDRGMLFIFEEQQPLSFWMANTPLPLDIIYVNKDKEIVRIHHRTQPYTEENFTSGEPALYAIETNGGFCVAHDIQEGMRVEF